MALPGDGETHAVAAQVPRFTEGGYVATRVLPPTPPAIAGARLVAAVGEGLAAFDIDKGTPCWQRPELDYLGQFAAMELGDGPQGQLVLLSSGEVLSAASGGTLIPRSGPLIPDAACRPVVEGRIAYFHAGSSAVRFWLDERGEVRHRLLWDSPRDIRKRQLDMNHGNHNGPGTPDFFCQGAYPPTPVIHDGLIFTHLAEPTSIERGPQNSLRCQVYDAATGCAVSQRYCIQINAMRPVASTVLAGGMLFCADEGGKRAYNYPNFPSAPAIAIVTAEEQPRRVASSQPGLATLSAPVFEGRRMYLAGSDQVVCIERPEALGDRFSDYELAVLKEGFYGQEIGDRPGPPSQEEIPTIDPPSDLTVGRGVPVVPLVPAGTLSRWLFGGPFAVEEKTDVFAGAGGAGAARPEEGLEVPYTTDKGAKSTVTFACLHGKHNINRDWATRYGNPKLEGGVDFASATGRKYRTTCYLYAVLENHSPSFYRADFSVKKMTRIAVYLAGHRLEPGCTVRLKQGRYPLMVQASIGTVHSHEMLEWYMQFQTATVTKAGASPQLPAPAPLDRLPEGTRTPVVPLLLGTFPHRLLGAWPLKDQAVDEPYAAMSGQSGTVVTEGVKIAVAGATAEFRAVPEEAIAPVTFRRRRRGGEPVVHERLLVDYLWFNLPVGTWPMPGLIPCLGLAPQALFGSRAPARGFFFAVLSNRRCLAVELNCPDNVRCWLAGRRIRKGDRVRLVPGLYPLLVECRVAAETPKAPVAPTFREVADPAIEMRRWLARVRRNAAMLKAIAACGPGGAYARAALEHLDRAQGSDVPKGTRPQDKEHKP